MGEGAEQGKYPDQKLQNNYELCPLKQKPVSISGAELLPPPPTRMYRHTASQGPPRSSVHQPLALVHDAATTRQEAGGSV